MVWGNGAWGLSWLQTLPFIHGAGSRNLPKVRKSPAPTPAQPGLCLTQSSCELQQLAPSLPCRVGVGGGNAHLEGLRAGCGDGVTWQGPVFLGIALENILPYWLY